MPLFPTLTRAGVERVRAAVERITHIKMTDQGCMLRAYNRSIVQAIVSTREVSTYIPALAYTFSTHPPRSQSPTPSAPPASRNIHYTS